MRSRIVLLIAAAVLTAAVHGGAQAEDGLIPSPEDGWPQWRGRRRDAVSRETGLLQEWPEDGPRLLWTADGLGRGWAQPIVTGGRIYVGGDFGDRCDVRCLDLAGKELWRTTNGKAWTRNHKGARAACCFAGGRIYHMNGHGRLVCLDAATGKEVWAQNVLDRFGGWPITWGISECVLVHDGKVFATPGGRQAFMVALDAKTGQVAWASPPLEDPKTHRTSYASPILLRLGDRKVLVTLALRALVCIDAESGKLYDTFPKRTKYDASCSTPVYHRGGVFYTLPTKSGSVFLDLATGDDGVRFKKAWEGAMDSCSGGAVAVDGHLYGSGWNATGWMCYDVATGTPQWEDKTIAVGSAVYADGRLVCLGERGTVALVKPSPKRFEIVSRFRLTEGDYRDAWTHPVILDGRLYLRYHDRLYCYDVRREGNAQ
jgi:outer membrane protein assembly factor BamB